MAIVDDKLFSDSYLLKANHVFLEPSPTYHWDEIVKGANVNSLSGSRRRMSAVAQNTFRGFHRINKNCTGAKEGFTTYFLSNKKSLVSDLEKVKTRKDLNDLSNRICSEVRIYLSNCNQTQLKSYNKVRKPVDLYIEHLVAMANELNIHRERLIPLLFLPIDSQIIAHDGLFTSSELTKSGLNRRSTYQEVIKEDRYDALQELLHQKASVVAQKRERPFYVIYFDLIWNNRHKNWGRNLFETNP